MNEPISFHQRCLIFGGKVLRLVDGFTSSRAATTVSSQLPRSATSIGANAHEARSAESRADFLHKMQIALKESRETLFWLGIAKEAALADPSILEPLLQECDELTAILAQSVITAKKNAKNS